MSFYPYLLLALSGSGMICNVMSLFIFAKQRFRRNFHRLLVILAIYDFLVRFILFLTKILFQNYNWLENCEQISTFSLQRLKNCVLKNNSLFSLLFATFQHFTDLRSVAFLVSSISSKKRTKTCVNLRFHSSKVEFVRLFFWGNVDLKKIFSTLSDLFSQ